MMQICALQNTGLSLLSTSVLKVKPSVIFYVPYLLYISSDYHNNTQHGQPGRFLPSLLL
jgi:hypothetical protein